MQDSFFSKNKSSLFTLLLTMVLPLSFSSLALYGIAQYQAEILQFCIVQWILFYGVTTLTMALALTPTTFVAIVSGYFLGWESLYGLVPSYLAASLLGYRLAQFIDRGKFMAHLQGNPKVSSMLSSMKKGEFWWIFFCRLSPALPFAMMNILLSFLHTGIGAFIGGSMVGMLPRTLLSVWLGLQAKDIIKILSGQEQAGHNQLVAIGLLVISVMGLFFLAMRTVRKHRSSNQPS
jgi:uncharacterized membrane protein YdjX (TVP38/TMEM64 family)